MVVRQFCEHRTGSAVSTDPGATNHEVADYLAGYAEALADRTSERRSGAADD
ncbi:hypothetical protein ABQF34_11440 [Mycolicibacterium boenickei]